MRHLLQQLALSKTQRQDIRQVIKQTLEDRGLYRQDMRGLRKDIFALVQAPQWDEQAVRTAIGQRQELLGNLALQKAISKQQVWQLLSTEQQAEFLQLVEQREAKERGTQAATGMLKGLSLSEEQSAAIDLLKIDLQLSRDGFQERRQAFKQAERALIQSEGFSQSDWQVLRLEYQDDFLSMALTKAKYKHDIWQVLTAEQQTQLKEKKRKHGIKKRRLEKHGERKNSGATD
jgi:Spy/CpxP family protein refolding chaperone